MILGLMTAERVTRLTDSEADITRVTITGKVTALHVLFHGIEIVPFPATEITLVARAHRAVTFRAIFSSDQFQVS